MPVKKVSKNGKICYKWGDSGTVYCGPGAKRKALKQGIAIELSKQRAGKKSYFDKSVAVLRIILGLHKD